MGERKVLNKYYPPDFDPAKLPRGKRQQNNEMKVRMMLPMSVRCKTCGTFMYKGTKFNTRKEDVEGEDYLGIKIFRFYYRCTNCAAEFCMKTDPKTSDYIMEQGASRNYEPWREADVLKAEAIRAREEEERGNAMKALENRTKDSKREMDIMEALDEMKSLKARHAGITAEDALRALQQAGAAAAEDEDDAGGYGEGETGAAAAAGDLADEDKAALEQFLQQRHTIMRRLDSDDESSGSGDEQGQGAGGPAKRRKLAKQQAGPTSGPSNGAAAGSNGVGEGGGGTDAGAEGAAAGTSSRGAGAAAAAAVKQSAAAVAKPVQPLVRVAVKAKKPQGGATADGGGGGQQQAAAAGADAGPGGLLGLIGDYGSSSGSEDNS